MIRPDETGRGAVLDIYGSEAEPARVHIQKFAPGAFGICVEPPERVPLDILHAGHSATDCIAETHLVRDEGGDHRGVDALIPDTPDDPSPGHF